MISPTYDLFKAKVLHVSLRLGIPSEEMRTWTVKNLFKTFDLMQIK